MGPANPWSAQWRPDPSGRRLATIRASRRGALLAAPLLSAVTGYAVLIAPEAASRPPTVAIAMAAMAVPALALLGAGLAPAALGSRLDAGVAGLALGLGAPVAAVTSVVIAAVMLAMADGNATDVGGVAGTVIRGGVIAAVRVAPMLAVAAAIWVLVMRRAAPPPRPALPSPAGLV